MSLAGLFGVVGAPVATAVAPLAAKVVDWGQLLEVVIAGIVAGVGVTIVFSLVIYGTVRAADAQHESRIGAMIANGALALVSLILCLVAVGFGLSTMLTK